MHISLKNLLLFYLCYLVNCTKLSLVFLLLNSFFVITNFITNTIFKNYHNPVSLKQFKVLLTYLFNWADLSDVEKSKSYETHFPDPDNLLFFKLEVKPSEGSYKGGRFFFSINVSFSKCKYYLLWVINITF